MEAENGAAKQARAKDQFRKRIEEGFQKIMSVTGIQVCMYVCMYVFVCVYVCVCVCVYVCMYICVHDSEKG